MNKRYLSWNSHPNRISDYIPRVKKSTGAKFHDLRLEDFLQF
jgi:hypothetical protein